MIARVNLRRFSMKDLGFGEALKLDRIARDVFGARLLDPCWSDDEGKNFTLGDFDNNMRSQYVKKGQSPSIEDAWPDSEATGGLTPKDPWRK